MIVMAVTPEGPGVDRAGEFEPEKYRDEYRERFLAFIDQKVKGQEITMAPPAPPRHGKVVDIMTALKQILEQTAPPITRTARQQNRPQTPEGSGLTRENAWHKRISQLR